ncbi:hypothetical protein [Nocardiopsis trehalosi]|uniref:hypothetical protein n=1 Tax=Nocardiopsis trehalosi TaxID=109329 RepID=UPI00082D61D7|nr:hypothetical protein [Nocardiopsis trehalosi]
MGHGFPSAKFFRIVNEGTGLCLAAAHGGTTHGAQKAHDRLTGEEGFIPYSHTNDQVLTVRRPRHDRAEAWFFCELESYGEAWWHLVNADKDIRSAFSLHVGHLDGASKPVGLGLQGWGQEGQTQWTARDKMFWPGPHEDKVATLLASGDGGYWAVAAERGSAPNQTWRFEEVDLPGEAVPVRKKGIYATREGQDAGKWYDEF